MKKFEFKTHHSGIKKMIKCLTFLGALLTGLNLQADNCVFMGHSHFIPYVNDDHGSSAPDQKAMVYHTGALNIPHSQVTVFSSGAGGNPENLWAAKEDPNDPKHNTVMTGVNAIETGSVDVLGLTGGSISTNEDFQLWFDFALSYNPDTKIFIQAPHLRRGALSVVEYRNQVNQYNVQWAGRINALRSNNPGVEIHLVNMMEWVAQMYEAYEAGSLKDGSGNDAVLGLNPPNGEDSSDYFFQDDVSHAGRLLEENGSLLWLSSLYGVDLTTYGSWDTGVVTADLKQMVMDLLENEPTGRPGGEIDPPTPNPSSLILSEATRISYMGMHASFLRWAKFAL